MHAEGSARELILYTSTIVRSTFIYTAERNRTHAERRMRSAAAREADFDEHRAEVRSFGCGGHDHREYDYRG